MPTLLFKNILIPTDFSPTANNAIQYGLELAVTLHAQVCLLHTYQTTEKQKTIGNIGRKETASMRNLQNTLEKMSERYPALSISVSSREGFLTDIVQELCEKAQTDLIVMGTKGASGIDEYLVGSNTALVMETVACPLLVIPKKAKYVPFKKMLFASDFKAGDISAIRHLAILAARFQAKVEVVHICTHQEEETTKMIAVLEDLCVNRFPETFLSFRNKIGDKSTLKELNKYLMEGDFDLASMSSGGKNFLKKLFTGSLTETMAYHTHLPFLAFHVKED